MELTKVSLFTLSEETGPNPHQHPEDWEFHYFFAGDGIFTTRGGIHRAPRGTLFLSAPGERHDTLMGSTRRVLFYYSQFRPGPNDGPLLDGLRARLPPGHGLFIGDRHRLAFDELALRKWSDNPHLRAAAHHQFQAFCHGLAGGGLAGGDENRRVMEAMGLLQASLDRKLGLAELSRRLGIDRFHLVKLFKRHTGLTPIAYHLRLRLDVARYLLAHSERTVQEISDELGFCNPFHFSRMFRRHAGGSPVAYRRAQMSAPSTDP